MVPRFPIQPTNRTTPTPFRTRWILIVFLLLVTNLKDYLLGAHFGQNRAHREIFSVAS